MTNDLLLLYFDFHKIITFFSNSDFSSVLLLFVAFIAGCKKMYMLFIVDESSLSA